MSAICGDMCPYIPCKDFPKCRHSEDLEKYIEELNKKRKIKIEGNQM